METVTALTGFDHGGLRKRGDRFAVSPQTAAELARKGLVRRGPQPEAPQAPEAPEAPADVQTSAPAKPRKKSES